MTKLQSAFLFFSVVILLVKLCFFIIEYHAMTIIAKRALAKKKLQEKLIDLAAIQNEERRSSMPSLNKKTAKEEIRVC